MTRIVLDAALRTRLHNLTEPLELTDEIGHVLGRFLPTIDPAAYEDLEPQIGREELARRRQMKAEYYTTAEVLTHLEKL